MPALIRFAEIAIRKLQLPVEVLFRAKQIAALHFLGFREVVIRSAGGGEFDRKGGEHRTVCRFRAVWRTQRPATSGN
jgi:hypothetical protein